MLATILAKTSYPSEKANKGVIDTQNLLADFAQMSDVNSPGYTPPSQFSSTLYDLKTIDDKTNMPVKYVV